MTDLSPPALACTRDVVSLRSLVTMGELRLKAHSPHVETYDLLVDEGNAELFREGGMRVYRPTIRALRAIAQHDLSTRR